MQNDYHSVMLYGMIINCFSLIALWRRKEKREGRKERRKGKWRRGREGGGKEGGRGSHQHWEQHTGPSTCQKCQGILADGTRLKKNAISQTASPLLKNRLGCWKEQLWNPCAKAQGAEETAGSGQTESPRPGHPWLQGLSSTSSSHGPGDLWCHHSLPGKEQTKENDAPGEGIPQPSKYKCRDDNMLRING